MIDLCLLICLTLLYLRVTYLSREVKRLRSLDHPLVARFIKKVDAFEHRTDVITHVTLKYPDGTIEGKDVTMEVVIRLPLDVGFD
jgi:hypothetical protein